MGSGTDVIITMWEGVCMRVSLCCGNQWSSTHSMDVVEAEIGFPPASDATAPICPRCEIRIC